MIVSGSLHRLPPLLLLVAAGALAFHPAPLQAGESTDASSCEDTIREAIAKIRARGWWGAALAACGPGMPGVSATGLRIVEMDSGGPAETAGLQPGDVIVSFNGSSLDRLDGPATQGLLKEVRPGDRLHLLVDRRGRRLELEVQATEMPRLQVEPLLGNDLIIRYAPVPQPQLFGGPPPAVSAEMAERLRSASRPAAEDGQGAETCARRIREELAEIETRGWLGMAMQYPGSGDSIGSVQVLEVATGGPAERADLRPGDLLVSLDGAHLRDLGEGPFERLLAEIRPGDRLPVVVERAGEEIRATLLADRMPVRAAAATLGARVMREYAPLPEPRTFATPPERPR